MSYILEALKKAESERQLGAVPDLLAQSSAQSNEGGARFGLWMIGGLLLLLIVLVGALLLRSAPGTPERQIASAVQAVPATVPAVTTFVPTVSPVTIATIAPAMTPAPIITPAPAPTTALGIVPAAPPIAAPSAPPTAATPLAPATPGTKPVPQTEPRPNVKPGTSAVPVPAPTQAGVPPPPVKPAEPGNNDAADEQLPLMAQLPEAIVREVPQVQVKGFIYSKIPTERTLIVGNNLFHEGDEVVPGVYLEKLLPKSAVMNYRGFRYRVGY
jgi:general secretion pathway protein B